MYNCTSTKFSTSTGTYVGEFSYKQVRPIGSFSSCHLGAFSLHMFGDSPKIRILKFGPVSIISVVTVV